MSSVGVEDNFHPVKLVVFLPFACHPRYLGRQVFLFFYWQLSRILFLKRAKFLTLYAFRFNTFILLFLPSTNPFVYGVSNEFNMYSNQFVNAFIQSFHSLRHTFATRAIECGVDIKTLAELLGHKNATITLNRYAHSLLEHKVDMMNKLGKLLWIPRLKQGVLP